MPTALRHRRKELDLSQDELADRVGCSQGAISAWELGLATIREKRHRRMLTAIFDCEISELEKENGPAKDEAARSPRRRSNSYDRY
jgi:transcriptional regulator with XRE-family HTH domain